MQASQRSSQNHALEYTLEQANRLRLPPLVLFVLTDAYPEANLRHYTFMLEGLRETMAALSRRGIASVVRQGQPVDTVVQVASQAAFCVTDRGYTRHQKAWRQRIAARLACPFIRIECDAIVPVETTSPKEEWAAATLRPKLGRTLLKYLQPVDERDPITSQFQPDMETVNLSTLEDVLATLSIDRSVPSVTAFRGGTTEARHRLDTFIRDHLDHYAATRSDPGTGHTSGLSPYLHFGQISPLEVALAVRDHGGPGADAFLEELVIRRELSLNFVHYNQHYDTFAALPAWAADSLRSHATDHRPYVYDRDTLERAGTQDPYWNAAQSEMLHTGSMHAYMRMYWSKKILEWSSTPADAYRTALYLNNRWQLDGRDPNSYAGIAWCFGKHDRAWAERPIFGKVRYMNAAGLERKFDMKAYAARHFTGE